MLTAIGWLLLNILALGLAVALYLWVRSKSRFWAIVLAVAAFAVALWALIQR